MGLQSALGLWQSRFHVLELAPARAIIRCRVFCTPRTPHSAGVWQNLNSCGGVRRRAISASVFPHLQQPPHLHAIPRHSPHGAEPTLVQFLRDLLQALTRRRITRSPTMPTISDDLRARFQREILHRAAEYGDLASVTKLGAELAILSHRRLAVLRAQGLFVAGSEDAAVRLVGGKGVDDPEAGEFASAQISGDSFCNSIAAHGFYPA